MLYLLYFALGFVCGIIALGGTIWIVVRSGHSSQPDAMSFDEYMQDSTAKDNRNSPRSSISQ